MARPLRLNSAALACGTTGRLLSAADARASQLVDPSWPRVAPGPNGSNCLTADVLMLPVACARSGPTFEQRFPHLGAGLADQFPLSLLDRTVRRVLLNLARLDGALI